jgi:hypothetical protein
MPYCLIEQNDLSVGCEIQTFSAFVNKFAADLNP